MTRGASRRRDDRERHRTRYCRRCGIEFTVFDDSEPDICYGCEEDVELEEISADDYGCDFDAGEFHAAEWSEES